MGWQQGNKPQALPVPDEHSNCWEVDWEGKARCTDGNHATQKPVVSSNCRCSNTPGPGTSASRRSPAAAAS
jgi:hypothetical protein